MAEVAVGFDAVALLLVLGGDEVNDCDSVATEDVVEAAVVTALVVLEAGELLTVVLVTEDVRVSIAELPPDVQAASPA